MCISQLSGEGKEKLSTIIRLGVLGAFCVQRQHDLSKFSYLGILQRNKTVILDWPTYNEEKKVDCVSHHK